MGEEPRDEIGYDALEVGDTSDADERIPASASGSSGTAGLENLSGRRRPGRPKGSRNRTPGAFTPEEITVTSEAGVRPKRAYKRRSAVKQEEAEFTAKVILAMLNTGAANIGGPQAVMNSFEQSLIMPCFERVLQRGGAASERVVSLVDPMALVVGLSMWGSRVLAERTAYRAQMGHLPASPVVQTTPDTPASPNGASSVIEDVMLRMQR